MIETQTTGVGCETGYCWDNMNIDGKAIYDWNTNIEAYAQSGKRKIMLR